MSSEQFIHMNIGVTTSLVAMFAYRIVYGRNAYRGWNILMVPCTIASGAFAGWGFYLLYANPSLHFLDEVQGWFFKFFLIPGNMLLVAIDTIAALRISAVWLWKTTVNIFIKMYDFLKSR